MNCQQYGYKNNVKNIPVRDINGQSGVLSKHVHDGSADTQSVTSNRKPISIEHDEHYTRLEPKRTRSFIKKLIACYKSTHDARAASGIDDNSTKEILSHIDHNLTEMREEMRKGFEDLNGKVDTILRQTFELAEFTVPRLFIVLPEDTTRYNPSTWFHLNYRLHFLCECENGEERHFAFHEGYKINQPRKFLRKYGPYLRKMLPVVKCALAAGSLIVPQLTHISSGISNPDFSKDRMFWNNLSTRIEQLDEILIEVEKGNNISSEKNLQHVEAAELREIQSFLKKIDNHRTFGNLFRSVTNDGHVRWVCVRHYDERYGTQKVKDLQKEFQKLGGEIKGDTAIIQGKVSNKLSAMLDVINRGLPVFSVFLKDLSLKKADFDKLISDVLKQSVIHNLELENITDSSFGFKMKTGQVISKLNKTVRENDKLNIQYSFTKPLSEFNSTLVDAIKDTNSRLFLRVRSSEDTPLFELTGTNETGFILSINKSDEKINAGYRTAMKTIFSTKPEMKLNITKIHLHKGTISESMWTNFYQFLTTNQSLQELTVNCDLTLEQTKALASNLSDNRTLKTLHMFNVWERRNELNGCKEIFEMLRTNTALIEFALTCDTDRLQLDFVARCLLQNKSLRILQLPKCMIHQYVDIVVIEDFLRNTSIDTLSLELISINCEEFLKRLARVVDKNKTLETLKLNGPDCFAIFHRQEHIADGENNVAGSSPAQISKRSSRSRFKRFLSLFSCHKRGNYLHQSEEEIVFASGAPIQNYSRKSVSVEPFYGLCKYPSLYKQIQEITENLKLEELQVTIRDDKEMSEVALSMKSNSTVTELRMDRRTLTENDIEMFVQGLRENTTITHLTLNEIKISIRHFHQIFNVLHDNRTLHVVDVRKCVENSYRDELAQEVKTLELENPSLKVVYENQ